MPVPLLRVASGSRGVADVTAPIRQLLLHNGQPLALAGPAAHTAHDHRVVAALDPDGPDVDDDIALVLTTSGSTGDPRAVLLSRKALRASVAAVEHLLGGPGRWVTAMPAHHVGGLMTVVRSVLAGVDPVAHAGVGGAAPFTADGFHTTTLAARTLANSDGMPLYVSLAPTQLDRLIAAGSFGLDALAAYDAVLSGSAATPTHVSQALRDKGIRLIESYGMTETCGGCVYDATPLAGVTVDTIDNRVRITGPVVAAGYRGRPELNALHFDPPGSFLTDDRGYLNNDQLTVTGRVDDVVKVGGTAVDLAALTTVLRHAPGVRDALAVGIPDPEWGYLPVALVVGTVDADVLGTSVAAELGRAAVPRSFHEVADLPRLASGKPDRQGALALALALRAT